MNIIAGDDKDVNEKVKEVFANSPDPDADFDKIVQANFPGALNNKDLVTKVVDILALKGYSESNCLLATSLCCDELARQLENDFNGIYGHNFNLGGLAGFPFAGNTGFGAMAAHIPDDGFCLIAYGPHVGLTTDGIVGKVERAGIELVDDCCGSAMKASDYVKGITDGGAQITTKIQEFTDFQQGAVQELILPHGKRLSDAENRMVELPYALYESQNMLMSRIVKKGSTGIKRGLALLGGVQINTGPDTLDYFVPLRFVFMNYRGFVLDDMLSSLKE
uniref:Limiting CO2-inducible protein B/C beta carbonyic anhydrase domain-containing protein n=1 Tax=Proboscia inermis TaxID=420281 RepID=A0A7S0GAM2_9STRA